MHSVATSTVVNYLSTFVGLLYLQSSCVHIPSQLTLCLVSTLPGMCGNPGIKEMFNSYMTSEGAQFEKETLGHSGCWLGSHGPHKRGRLTRSSIVIWGRANRDITRLFGKLSAVYGEHADDGDLGDIV